jgi:hypothetical protein
MTSTTTDHSPTTRAIPAPPDATEVFAWTQHGPDLARRPFGGLESASPDQVIAD